MMQPHLVFTLAATMAAMGDLAGHERRGSLLWPGRSGILGLMGAALGLRREDDFSALDALSVGVAVFEQGAGLRDYHTVETVPTAVAKRPNSRPQALRVDALRNNTTITLRDYRVGVLYGIAVWGGQLESLCTALNAPQFTLYLGRKSCPLSAPPGARVVMATGPEAALTKMILPPWFAGRSATRFITDDDGTSSHVELRHDAPRDRALWHFAPRRVAFRTVNIRPEGVA
ncbi:MAG: type I-E CRISPR-associated protein Cas5/CasD [Rhodobacteraceae bacterium PARR1]|nr:MAG: type I-E CRISPR-associated protein Cas5/CasD [Rhodobacteraceae bacterium PARR1]